MKMAVLCDVNSNTFVIAVVKINAFEDGPKYIVISFRIIIDELPKRNRKLREIIIFVIFFLKFEHGNGNPGSLLEAR